VVVVGTSVANIRLRNYLLSWQCERSPSAQNSS